MSNEPGPAAASGAVFLSYASQDSDAAQRICDALRARGVEVWFDRTELEGGDAWDAKIKRQIRDCALFIPLISANSQSRQEGYFRREWNLATHRLLDMAPGTPFLLPVAIDDTAEHAALVAEEFLRVQWSRLPNGETTPAFVERVLQLLAARAVPSRAPFRSATAPGRPAWPVRPGRWRWITAAGLALSLLAGWLAQRQGWLDLGPGIPDAKQIVIIPFINIGPAPAKEAFSDGLSETITAQLAQLQHFQHALLVVPMSEVRKEAVSTASDARRVFGATLALSGSVQREAGVVRVTVNLVDTRTLRILRSATLDHPTAEVYRLQDRVAAQTAEWLGLKLSAEAKGVLASGQTTVAPAYELYLQGLGELARKDRPDNLDAAIVHLQQALVSDPHYALAHAALGEAFWEKYVETKARLWIDEARRSCNSALEFGATLAAPHVTLAVILNGTGQYEQAAGEAQTALRLDPASTDATRALARAHDRLNRPAEAEAALQRVLDRNPANGLAHMAIAAFYWRAGRNAEAETHFIRVTELMPDNYAVYRNLGGLYVMMGRPERAAELLEKSIALKPSASAYSNLGTLRFQQQRYADAAGLFEQASHLSPGDHLLLGNLADALRYIPARASEAGRFYAQATGLADEALRVNPKDAAIRASLARYCAFSGTVVRAREEIVRACAMAPANLPIFLNAAVVFERIGERELALEALGVALKGGYPPADINQNPDLSALRADPRFSSLLSAPAKTTGR